MYGKYTVYKSEAQLGILTMNYNITTEEKYTNSNYLSIHNTGNTKKLFTPTQIVFKINLQITPTAGWVPERLATTVPYCMAIGTDFLTAVSAYSFFIGFTHQPLEKL